MPTRRIHIDYRPPTQSEMRNFFEVMRKRWKISRRAACRGLDIPYVTMTVRLNKGMDTRFTDLFALVAVYWPKRTHLTPKKWREQLKKDYNVVL